jgi:hypothetical protein
MYAKEISSIQESLIKITSMVAGKEDPTEAIKNAQVNIDKLRQSLVGADDTIYTYVCESPMCKNPCTLTINCVLSDKTFCMDSLSPGLGKFEDKEFINMKTQESMQVGTVKTNL